MNMLIQTATSICVILRPFPLLCMFLHHVGGDGWDWITIWVSPDVILGAGTLSRYGGNVDAATNQVQSKLGICSPPFPIVCSFIFFLVGLRSWIPLVLLCCSCSSCVPVPVRGDCILHMAFPGVSYSITVTEG